MTPEVLFRPCGRHRPDRLLSRTNLVAGRSVETPAVLNALLFSEILRRTPRRFTERHSARPILPSGRSHQCHVVLRPRVHPPGGGCGEISGVGETVRRTDPVSTSGRKPQPTLLADIDRDCLGRHRTRSGRPKEEFQVWYGRCKISTWPSFTKERGSEHSGPASGGPP